MLIYVLALKGINHEFFLLKIAGHLTGFFFLAAQIICSGATDIQSLGVRYETNE